jgi:hypothetical protein
MASIKNYWGLSENFFTRHIFQGQREGNNIDGKYKKLLGTYENFFTRHGSHNE